MERKRYISRHVSECSGGHEYFLWFTSRWNKTSRKLSCSHLLPVFLLGWVHHYKVRAWILRTLHCLCCFIFTFPHSLIFCFSSTVNPSFELCFPLTITVFLASPPLRDLEESRKAPPGSVCERPALGSSCSEWKHSWHPVQNGLALSNYLVFLVKSGVLGMHSLASIPCGDDPFELNNTPCPLQAFHIPILSLQLCGFDPRRSRSATWIHSPYMKLC